MTKECLDHCPCLKSIIGDIRNDNLWAGPLAIHPDFNESNLQELLKACKNTYNCKGPRVITVMVEKGRLRKRLVSETRWVCGLDPQVK